MEKKSVEYLRSNFVRGISTNHVQNGKSTAGMLSQPRVESKHVVLENDNTVALGNHAVHRLGGQDAVARHLGGRWAGVNEIYAKEQ